MGKLVRNGISYSDPVVDDRLNENSKNPVQNKVLAVLLNHFVFSANSKTYYLQPEQPSNPQDGDIWIG